MPVSPQSKEPERKSALRVVASLVAFAAAAAFGIRWCGQRIEPSEAPAEATDSEASPRAPLAPVATKTPRCVAIAGQEGFVVGEPSEAKPSANDDASPFEDAPEEADLSPFAIEVGRGTTYDGGFALGALRDAEGGSVANVVTIGFDGRGGKVVRLARSRGDMDAPVVAGVGNAVIAGMLEPNAGGRALRLAKVEGGQVTWGIELAQGRDESLAFDVAASPAGGVAVWDDVSRDRKRSSVFVASFDPATMKPRVSARPVSGASVDADTPRIIAREGGFWLAYVAREEIDTSGRGRSRRNDVIDEENSGEVVSHAWIEAMPLDPSGVPAAAPKRVSAKDGHVLAFDIELGDDGGALLAWRDDDTPMGSSGGNVMTALVTLSGVHEPRVLVEEGVGDGIPDLLPGWIAIASVRGAKRFAPLRGSGELAGSLDPEPNVGIAEPLAATAERLLLARPAGRSMRLEVVRCVAEQEAPEDGGAEDAQGR